MLDYYQIKIKLNYEKILWDRYKDSPKGSEDYERGIIALNLFTTLEWVLEEQDPHISKYVPQTAKSVVEKSDFTDKEKDKFIELMGSRPDLPPRW